MSAVEVWAVPLLHVPPPWTQCVPVSSTTAAPSGAPASTLVCSLQAALAPEGFWGSFTNHQGLNLLVEEAVKLLGLRFSRRRSENKDGCRGVCAWSIPGTPSLPWGWNQGSLAPATKAPWKKQSASFPRGIPCPWECVVAPPILVQILGKGVQTPAEFIGKCYHWLKQAWAAVGTRGCHGNSLLMCPGFETTFPSSPALNAASFFCCCFVGGLLSWGEVVQVARGSGDQEGTERTCSSQGGLCGWETFSTCRDPTNWGLDGPWRVTVLWEQGRISQGYPAPKGTQLGCSEPPKRSLNHGGPPLAHSSQ